MVSEVYVNKEEGGWKVDQESFHQAWVDVYKVLSGEKHHFGPVEGEPVMGSLDSWYEKAWSGISGEREYAGRYVNSQGLLTDQWVPITGIVPTPGKVSGRSAYQKSMYLNKLAQSGKAPRWMSTWLSKGKVPPGYQVDQIEPLSIGGKDIPANMRLNLTANHRLHHKWYRPWQK